MNITMTNKELGELLKRHRDWVIEDVKEYFNDKNDSDEGSNFSKRVVDWMDDFEAQIEGKESIDLLGIDSLQQKS